MPNNTPRTATSAQPSTQQLVTFQPSDKALTSLYVGGDFPPVLAKLANE